MRGRAGNEIVPAKADDLAGTAYTGGVLGFTAAAAQTEKPLAMGIARGFG